jgi:hypothetical protein
LHFKFQFAGCPAHSSEPVGGGDSWYLGHIEEVEKTK